MRFEKFVKRSTKGLFLFLVIIMAVSLVLWGNASTGDKDSEAAKPAGVIYGDTVVTRADYRQQLNRAVASHKWNTAMQYGDPRYLMLRLPPPKQEDLVKQAWQNLVLLEDARRKGISSGEREVLTRTRDLFDMVTQGRQQLTDQSLDMFASSYLGVSRQVFDGWMSDNIVIEKLLGLVTESEFTEFSRIYDEVLKGNRLARAWYAGVDPNDHRRELKPPRAEEIASHYEKNKTRYRIPDKIQISYILADADALKKTVAEPTEEEVKKYYEDNKSQFAREHKHAPGERHRDDEKVEHKPLDEVRAEVVEKFKTKKAQEQASKIMSELDKEIGASLKDNKYPDNLFDTLQEAWKKKGIELVHDVTTAFDRKHIEDVEKAVGAGGDLATWGFAGDRKEKEISRQNDTTKGSLFYRIQRKTPAYDPGLTEPVRERITKELLRDQLKKRAQQVANNIVQEIHASGLAAARRRHPLDWQITPYFKVGAAGSAGGDAAVVSAIDRQVSSGQLQREKAAALAGSVVGGAAEKRDWSWVAYLEDEVGLAPGNVETSFKDERRKMERQDRMQARRKYVETQVKLADVKDELNKDKPTEKPAEIPTGSYLPP